MALKFHPRYNFLRLDYWFGQVDSRPLSFFRICFAALLLKNALYLIPVAHLLFSDAGIVPRAQFWSNAERIQMARFSVMNYFPQSWMAILFFTLWAGICVMLLVGYQTRLMAVLTYLIGLTVINRNPFVMTGADHVMTVLSFWMIFLPLNHHYSVDAWLAQRKQRYLRQIGTAQIAPLLPSTTYAFPLRIIQIQVAVIYIFTSYYKWQEALWPEGDALFFVFQQIGYLLPLGIWIGQIAPLWLLRLLTWSVLLIEAAFAPLVFLPVLQPWARATGLALAALMHLGIAIAMDIPDFSLVMWISYIVFFEPSWVMYLEKQMRRLFKRPSPSTTGLAASAPSFHAVKTRQAAIGRLLLAVLLTMLLTVGVWSGIQSGPSLWNTLAPARPMIVRIINYHLHLGSGWQMFVYSAIPRTAWVMIYGRFENGAITLLHTGANPQTGQMYRQWGPYARLRLLEQHLAASFPSTILRAWGDYYCRFHNAAQNRQIGMRLTALEIHVRYRLTHVPDAPPNPFEDDLIWSHRCLPS